MSMLKNVGLGIAGVVGVSLVGYLGFKGFKKLRGKKEETIPPTTCYTKDQLEVLLKEDERIYNELKALHYSDEVLAKLRESIAEKRAELARMK